MVIFSIVVIIVIMVVFMKFIEFMTFEKKIENHAFLEKGWGWGGCGMWGWGGVAYSYQKYYC
jgi:hypothetical protein